MVLSDTGAFETVEVARQRPDPMVVKEVTVRHTVQGGRRRHTATSMWCAAMRTRPARMRPRVPQLRSDGPKSVVANKGYKRYLKAEKGAFAIDLDKARDEERFDACGYCVPTPS